MNLSSVLNHWPIEDLLAIVTGIVILVMPRVLNYAVAIYLLVIGALGLLSGLHAHSITPQVVISLVAGVLILIKPSVLNYIVGIYLVVFGLLESGIIRPW